MCISRSNRSQQIKVGQLQHLFSREREGLQVVDVCRSGEWQEGHVEGAVLKPLNQLPRLLDELDSTRPIAV
jgi:rhodanese-related sulfurtransferase